MPPPELYKSMIPACLNPNKPVLSDNDIQQLDTLPDLVVVSDKEPKSLVSTRSNYHNGVPRQLNVRSDKDYNFGELFQSGIGERPSKRQRTETPVKLNAFPRNVSSWLPSRQPYPDPTPIVEQKVFIPLKRSEEFSSITRRYFYTPTTPVWSPETVSGSSDVTKLDVMDNSPLCNTHVQGLVTSKNIESSRENACWVYRVSDRPLTNREIQAERPLKHDKLGSGVDVVEPMECDEQTKCEVNAHTVPLEKRSKRDVSLVERFTEEEIKLHIKSLKEGSIQGEIRETCENKEDPCQLCGNGPLVFPIQPIYCSLCQRRIKDKSIYYITEEKIGDQHQICNPCYNRCRSELTLPSGVSISKANMLKKNNADNQNTEEWVYCGSCEKWQHQICGLYNKHKDVDKTADYICPNCLLKERQSINNTGLHDNTDLGAKDLPETILSHFIEQRLFRRLKEERQQTAKATGKSIDDVSEPGDLTLRVVFSSTDKTSYVNEAFADLLHKEHYPSKFPHRSKTILLFQKVEGVDVCIFALFVQEFGSKCSQPNQRSIYIVYLDSVKYFRPNRPTFSGEALRTFVYHEILIGYLEYCKIRGFTTGYIWACPPPKGEDYIMYSHPKTQQTPSTKKLRQWYLSMLDKATEQGVVSNVTNLYNRFFVTTEESTSNITAARLPYFEGSFWSHSAANLAMDYEREGSNELKKKAQSISRRALNGIKSKDGVGVDDAKKVVLTRELEKMISQKKEDVMVVDLNYSCTRCSEAILSGSRWFCKKCKNLQLCQRCHDAEEELPGEHMHNMNGKEKHSLSKVQVNGIQSTTEDTDIILETKTFESRQEFLGSSQKHNYSFDTLRRAKHSSMMILHHLHTSNKPHCPQNLRSVNQVTCTACDKDVSTTVHYPCLICSGYRLCTACYTKKTVLRMLHLFPILPSTCRAPPRTVGALEILNALVHAHTCRPTATSSCSYPKCNDCKILFSHSAVCEIGTCKICTNFRKILNIHAYHCQDLTCSIPRCSDTKKYFVKKGFQDLI